MKEFAKDLTNRQLLELNGIVVQELKDRAIARTGNNPLSDYTEWLVSNALGLKRQRNSTRGFDALGEDGVRYEIKARRVTPTNPSLQLSAIRAIEAEHFDYLIAVIYNEVFDVTRAFKIPRGIVQAKSTYTRHTNSYILHAKNSLVECEGVEVITAVIAAVHDG